MNKYFDFEKPIEVIDDKIKVLESKNEDNNLDLIKCPTKPLNFSKG